MANQWMAIVVMCVLVVGNESRADTVRLRSPDGTVRNVPEQSVEFALKDGYTRIPTIRMRTPEGAVVDVDEDHLDHALSRGYWQMTELEIKQWNDAEFEKMMAASRSASGDSDDWRETVSLWALVGIMFSIVGYIMVRGRRG